MKPLNLHILSAFLTIVLVSSCSQEETAFLVEAAEDIEKPNDQDALAAGKNAGDANGTTGNQTGTIGNTGDAGKTANYGNDNPAAPELKVYKDNGMAPGAGGSVPAELYDTDTGALDTSKQEATYSSRNEANSIADGAMMVNTEDYVSELKITMNRMEQSRSAEDTQITRNSIMDEGRQGWDPSATTETFDQNERGVVDVLFVMDDSGSMTQEQLNLSTKLNALIGEISDSNWRIGVVDTYDSTWHGLVTKQDADPAAGFEDAIKVCSGDPDGRCRSRGNERGFRAAVDGLKHKIDGNSWLRPGSSLAVVVVSDEDNCSSEGNGCANSPDGQTSYLTDYFASIRPEATNPARFYGIIWDPAMPKNAPAGSTDEDCPTGANKGVHYKQVAMSTGGSIGSICADDYGPVLANISANISAQLMNQFSLAHEPVNEPVVTVRDAMGNVITGLAYTRVGQVITFSTEPPAGSKITVDYMYGGKARASKYALSKRPALQYAPFAVTKSLYDAASDSFATPVAVAASDYDVVEENGSYHVQFSAGNEPEDAAKIFFDYKEYAALKDELSMSCAYELKQDPASVKVWVGSDLKANSFYSVDFGNKKVKFDQNFIPMDGQTFKVEYTCYQKVLSYNYAADAQASDLYVYDAASKQQVSVGFDNDADIMTFDESLWSYGKEYMVRNNLDVLAVYEGTIAIPVEPIMATLKVTAGAVVCDGANVSLEDGKLNLTQCGLGSYSGTFEISYKYVAAANNKHQVPQSFLTGNEHDTRIYKITVVNADGSSAVTTDYKIVGNEIEFNDGAISKNARWVELEITLMTREM